MAGKPGPVSDTSITTTAPSRRPVIRTWSRAGSFGALAPPGDADLIPRRVVRSPRFQSLHGVPGEIEQDTKQLVGVRIDNETALDRGDPGNPGFRQSQGLMHLLDQRLDVDRFPVGRRFLRTAVG